ncbi:hypothetical protein QBC35DRAFT_459557 [Podospora australis]|uniref:SET domain-containing protein n=1 Tax=Podospora australis TaxID=1536484 RepID=A0AAN7AP10_9PEZI|nr:hypothetical protein QBC35DRAFT_459557 [Podospora australis]
MSLLKYTTVASLLAAAAVLGLQTTTTCPSSPPFVLRQEGFLSAELPTCPDSHPKIDSHLKIKNHYTPWTHAPDCEPATGGKDIYCAYTNSHHGSRGWSIVTSPEVAADVIGTGYLDAHVNLTRLAGSSFEVVSIEGKGKGVLATRDIKKGDEILLDYAALVVDISFTAAVPVNKGYRLLHTAVDRMGDGGNGVMELGKSNEFAQDVVEDVLRTNAFQMALGGVPHMAVYPAVSRINHACKPNAYIRFIEDKLQVSVAAAKDIKQGEEITISYITLGKPSEERKKNLKQWGFECSCDLCTASPAEVQASDNRRKKIEELRDYAIRAFQAGKPYQALRLTRQVINLLASEELFPMYSEQYENMARIFWVLNDMKNAEKYARMSLDILVEQGYIPYVKDEYIDVMWRRFEQEEGPRGERY